MSGRRRPRFAMLAAASLALLAVVVAAAVLGNRGPTVDAETPLLPVGGGAADGTVALVGGRRGAGRAAQLRQPAP
jgi:hypothetical protein